MESLRLTSSSEDSLYDESLDPRRSTASSSSGGSRAEISHPAHYAFAQAFGERGGDVAYHFDLHDADMLSAVRFNPAADMVATGDKGGRIVLLKRVDSGSKTRRRKRAPIGDDFDPSAKSFSFPDGDDLDRSGDVARTRSEPPEFQFWTQFQSHEMEFDYLKSMEIEEKINEIRWCREANGAQRLIAINDKTIKLWRVFERDVKQVLSMTPSGARTQALSKSLSKTGSLRSSANRPWGYGKCMPPSMQKHLDAQKNNPEPIIPLAPPSPTPPPTESEAVKLPSFQELRSRYEKFDVSRLAMPKVSNRQRVISASPRRVFSNLHAYHINSVSLSSDEETFLTADDLRINVWNLHLGEGRGFNIVDIKPGKMVDLTEVITRAEFHPEHGHIFMHANSRGTVKLSDFRQNALCDKSRKSFEVAQNRFARSSFFSEIVGSISDCKFSPDGRYIVTRDFMNLRLWDVNMEREPLLSIPVHEHLRPKLADTYENDCIFDKFHCAFSHDGGSLLTGSYGSLFQSYSSYDGTGAAVEATVDFVSGLSNRAHLYSEGVSPTTVFAGNNMMPSGMCDPSRRILRLDSAINEPLAAVAAGPALYIYYVSQ